MDVVLQVSRHVLWTCAVVLQVSGHVLWTCAVEHVLWSMCCGRGAPGVMAWCHGMVLQVSWHGVMAWCSRCHGMVLQVSWHGVMAWCHGMVLQVSRHVFCTARAPFLALVYCVGMLMSLCWQIDAFLLAC